MNEVLKEFAKETLKKGLAKLPIEWQNRFKQMYSCDNLNKSINEVVDEMPDSKLDWAMQQVQNSINKMEVNK